jgi:Protein of unknown function (DUF2971)
MPGEDSAAATSALGLGLALSLKSTHHAHPVPEKRLATQGTRPGFLNAVSRYGRCSCEDIRVSDADGPKPDTGLAADLWLADNAWKESWLARAADLPTTVYHYTDAAGLLGIIRTGQLWASHANFVNDSGELRYVDGLLEQVIAELSHEFDANLVHPYLSAIPGLFKEVVVDNFEFYIACFCEHGDQLSQWRGYPSTGGGYAIGFDPTVLGKGRLLRNVIYDVDEQRALLTAALRPACELIRDAYALSYDAESEYIQKSAVMAAQAAVSSVAECSWSFKHPGFAEEKEYRLLRASANERDGRYRVVPKMRASLFGLLPYTTIDFVQPGADAVPAITEVVVGPNQHPVQAIQAVRHLLAGAGYVNADTMVRESAIPLRV